MKELPSAEALFVSRFVTKNRRERVAMELADPRRRAACLLSFSEPHRERLMLNRLSQLPESCAADDALAQLCAHGCKRRMQAYIMHPSGDYDQQELPLEEAVRTLWYRGPAVILCETCGTGLLLLDSGAFGTMKFILSDC